MNRKRTLLTSIAILIAFVIGAAFNNLLRVPSVHADTLLSIPKNFGTVKATMGASLVLEDSSGTIRVIDITGSVPPKVISRN